jgi:hypothetical protein
VLLTRLYFTQFATYCEKLFFYSQSKPKQKAYALSQKQNILSKTNKTMKNRIRKKTDALSKHSSPFLPSHKHPLGEMPCRGREHRTKRAITKQAHSWKEHHGYQP